MLVSSDPPHAIVATAPLVDVDIGAHAGVFALGESVAAEHGQMRAAMRLRKK